MAFTKDPNPANIDANYIYTSTASYTPAALPESGDDGIRYLFIRTKDNVGNLSGWENMFTYVYDTTPPLGVRNESIVEIHGVKSGIPQGKVNHPTFRWTAPDDPRPITYDLYWVEAGEDGCGDPGTTFMHVNEPEVTYEDWPELGMEKAGAKCLLVFAVDEAGNRSEQYATFVFILSETPPILKITDFTSQPEVTSLGKADMFTVNGRKKIIYGKDFVGTITITVSTGTSDDQTVNEGIKSIQFPSLFGDLGETISFDPATYLTDTYSYEYFVPAGATHAGSFNVTLTTENGTKIHAPFDLICESSAPLISDLNLNSGLFASFVVGDILYHGESSYGTLTVSVNATEPEPDANNGYSKVDVVIFPSLASSDTSSDDTSPYSHTWSPITLTGEDDGIYTITAIDNFGNSSFKTFQIISDSTGPDVILDISDAPGMVFIVNWSAHDRDVAPGIPGSGVDHYQARLVPANTSCDSISVIAELDNGSTQKTSVEIADSGVNTPKLCVRAYDRVGNAGAWAEKQPEVVTETAYYPFNGQSVAMSRNGQTYYFGTDHLGSISVTVRQDGTVASEMRYEPYGQVRWIKGTVLSDKSYTGQRSESGFGLMDYNARWYDPSIMMFTSPDTMVPDFYNPLDWNRYLYARANPVNLTDPTGHFACGDGIDDPRCEQYENRYKKDLSDDNTEAKICTITNCDPQYYSVAVGIDAPTVITLTGLGISFFAPEVGVPIGLAGLGFELCAYTGSPLCAAVKLASFNAAFTLDTYGNLYVGPQFSWGKSILPVGAFSFNMGSYIAQDGHVPTEIEMEDSLQGFSASAGTIATGGLSFSPTAKTNKVAYYMVGLPELFSFNFQYNYLIHDFSP